MSYLESGATDLEVQQWPFELKIKLKKDDLVNTVRYDYPWVVKGAPFEFYLPRLLLADLKVIPAFVRVKVSKSKDLVQDTQVTNLPNQRKGPVGKIESWNRACVYEYEKDVEHSYRYVVRHRARELLRSDHLYVPLWTLSDQQRPTRIVVRILLSDDET